LYTLALYVAGSFIVPDPRTSWELWDGYHLSWVEVLLVAAAMMAIAEQLKTASRHLRLEADVRFQADRADRAEKWLYKISVEIEQKFFSEDDSRRAQAPTSQARS
jgi:hypothetical protein